MKFSVRDSRRAPGDPIDEPALLPPMPVPRPHLTTQQSFSVAQLQPTRSLAGRDGIEPGIVPTNR
jgi:hypothetical protein